jgi:hypothetical protein
MSNVEQLADHQKKRDQLILEYITFLNYRCASWLEQKLYEEFHADAVVAMLIMIKKQVTKSPELREAYINFTMRFKYDSFIEFERLQKVLNESEHTHLTLETIRPGQWFHEKHNNYMDIAHAIRQLPRCSLKIDWWDEKCYLPLKIRQIIQPTTSTIFWLYYQKGFMIRSAFFAAMLRLKRPLGCSCYVMKTNSIPD